MLKRSPVMKNSFIMCILAIRRKLLMTVGLRGVQRHQFAELFPGSCRACIYSDSRTCSITHIPVSSRVSLRSSGPVYI